MRKRAPTGETRWAARFALGLAITVGAIVSQYVVPSSVPAADLVYGSLLGDVGVVYGIPLAAWLALFGARPLGAFARRTPRAAVWGLAYYGVFSILALGATIAAVALLAAFDPAALALLSRPNPVLVAAEGNPLFFIGFSFVAAAFEETIFRGFIYQLAVRPGGSWVAAAAGSSALFAGVHLYYAETYGLAVIAIAPSLFAVGFAFAATVEMSGGNLVVVIVLHGALDAAAFLSLLSGSAALAAHYLPIVAGVAIAVGLAGSGRPFLPPRRTEGGFPPAPATLM